jgi:hypothetical protein
MGSARFDLQRDQLAGRLVVLDDSLRGRPATAAPARELGWNRDWSSIDCLDCHAGCLTSSGPFHLRNFGGRDFVLTLDAPASYEDHDCRGQEAEDR